MIDAAQLRVVVSADTSKAQSELKSFSGSMKNVAGGMAAVGGILSATVAAPLIGIGVSAIKTAASFERSMNVLGYVTEGTSAQMQAMSDQALQLGADTVFSANEAAEGMVELAKANMDTEDVMGAIPGVMDLAAAGGIAVSEAASLAAATIATFGLEAAQTTEVADVLAAAANASSADIRDLAFGVQNAGSVFAASGQSVETLATMMALLANNGLNASDAATSLKTMTMRLTAPTNEAAKVMSKLGIAVFDADGNMRDYQDIIGDLEGATKGLSDEARSAALSTIFGADAIRAAIIMANEGVTGFEAMNTAVSEQGAAAEMAAAQNSGLSGTMESIAGSIESMQTKLALPFLDTISEQLGKLKTFVDGLGEIPQPVVNAALAFLAFAGAVGLALVAAAGIATVFSTFAAGGIAATVGTVTVAMLGLGLAAAIAWAAWSTNWMNIQTKTEEVIAAIKPLIDGLIANLTTIGTEMGKIFTGGTAEAPTFEFDFTGIAEQITTMVDDITEAVNKLDVTTIDWWTLLNDLIVEPIGAAMAVMGFSAETLTNLVTAVTTAITEIPWGDLGGAFANLTTAVITQLGTVVNDIIADLTPLFFLMSLSIGEQVRLLKAQMFPEKPVAATPADSGTMEADLAKVEVSFTAALSASAIRSIEGATAELEAHDWEAEGAKWGTITRNGIITGFTTSIGASWSVEGALTTWATSVGTQIETALRDINWSGIGTALANLQTTIYAELTRIAKGFGEALMGSTSDDTSVSDRLRGVEDAPFSWAEFIPEFTWPPAIAAFTWPETIFSFAWPESIFSFAWPESLEFSWGEWMEHLDWGRYISWLAVPAAPAGGGGGGGGGGGFEGKASGTSYWKGGPLWVGEEGPELVTLPQGSRIYSNEESMGMGGTTINVFVDSINSALDIEALAAQLARRFQQKMRL